MLEAGTKIFKVSRFRGWKLVRLTDGTKGILGEESDISQPIAGQSNPPDSFLIFAKYHAQTLLMRRETEASHRGQS